MKAVVLDIEATGFSWSDQILCIAAASVQSDPVVPHVQHISVGSINVSMTDMFTQQATYPEVYAFVQHAIKDADWIVGHNLSYDIPYLIRDGLLTFEQISGKVFDTLIAARMTGSHVSCSLESLTNEYGIGFASEEEVSFYRNMKSHRGSLKDADPAAVLRYCQMDAERNLKLFEKLHALSIDIYGEARMREEGDYVALVSKMRVTGMPLDLPGILALAEEKKAELHQLKERLVYDYNINGPNASGSLLAFLNRFDMTKHLGKTPTGAFSLDEEQLLGLPGVKEYIDLRSQEALGDEDSELYDKLRELVYPQAIAMVLDARALVKQLSTWIEKFNDEADGRGWVHPLWGAGATVSYRLNCKEPPAQTIDKHLSFWGVPDGYVRVTIDLEQAELKLGAAYAVENKMAQAFADGIDIHTATASEMYEVQDLDYFKSTLEGKLKRRNGKVGNFAGFYGGGWQAIDNAIHCGRTMAQKIRKLWSKVYPNIVACSEQASELWKKRGYLVLSHGKRIYASPDDLIRRPYKAFNQLVQASIAEIIRVAMQRIADQFTDVLIIGQIHDSIMLLVPIDRYETYKPQLLAIVEGSAPEAILSRTTPPIRMTADIEEFYPQEVADVRGA